MSKISYRIYYNERLKQVDFHGQQTHPLYIQVTFNRRPIYFKSYYFELFSKPRYFLVVPGIGSKGPDIAEVIEREKEVIEFIIEKHKDNFSLDVFKTAYAHYSKDLCDTTEKGFIDYLFHFFWDEGMPAYRDVFSQGSKKVIAFEMVRDMKRSFNQPLYERLIGHSLYYAPPYLPLYGFMERRKRWPMLILTVMEMEENETKTAFKEYLIHNFPQRPALEILAEVEKCSK